MRILITGASGLLGLNLTLDASREHRVFGTVHSHLVRVVPSTSQRRFEIIQIDLLQPGAVERLVEETSPDWVIHCAALADLEKCESDPALAQKLNTELPEKLARHVARGGARLLHISTDAVFDGFRGGYTEHDPPNPLSVYAKTKLDGEAAVLAANPDALVARINIFGWSLTGSRSLAEFFFYNLSAGQSAPGFTDVHFCPLLVNDLAGFLLLMLERQLKGLYHVVAPQSISKYQFGVLIARRFGFDEMLIQPASVSESGLIAARSHFLTLSTHLIEKDLGITFPEIEQGIDRFYQLYQQGYPALLHGMAVNPGRP